jgi:hypothetical protein
MPETNGPLEPLICETGVKYTSTTQTASKIMYAQCTRSYTTV